MAGGYSPMRLRQATVKREGSRLGRFLGANRCRLNWSGGSRDNTHNTTRHHLVPGLFLTQGDSMPEWIEWGMHPDFLLTVGIIAGFVLWVRPWRRDP